jgi:hypothetical protein
MANNGNSLEDETIRLEFIDPTINEIFLIIFLSIVTNYFYVSRLLIWPNELLVPFFKKYGKSQTLFTRRKNTR